MSLKKHENMLTSSRNATSLSARIASAARYSWMSKRLMKSRHFISFSNKSHNRNDPGTNEKQNHYVDLSHQHSWPGLFTRSIAGFEQHGNHFSKFTFPSFLAFGSTEQESNFLRWRCQWNSNARHQLHEFLGLGHTPLCQAKTQKHSNCLLGCTGWFEPCETRVWQKLCTQKHKCYYLAALRRFLVFIDTKN